MKNGSYKVAVFATVTDFGGAERVVLSLLGHVSSRKFELVPIIFTRKGGESYVFLEKMKDIPNIKPHFIFVNRLRLKYLNPFVNLIDSFLFLKKGNFDLIHSHGYRADLIGIFLSILLKIPLISTCHGFISTDNNLNFYNFLDRFFLKYAKKILAVSEGIKRELVQAGISESRIEVLKNAISVFEDTVLWKKWRNEKRVHFNIPEEKFVIGYVGRLSEEKGIHFLLHALFIVHQTGIPIFLLILGVGPLKNRLEDIVKNQGLRDKVVFTGFQHKVEKWLPAMDVFCLPSLTEGSPMALLEAMAFGVPVVASTVGGIPQIIENGKNGILVPSGDENEIAKALLNLYNDPLLRNKISLCGQKTLKDKYSIKNWANRVEMEYGYVLKGERSNGKNGHF